jgi:hypothetical protein
LREEIKRPQWLFSAETTSSGRGQDYKRNVASWKYKQELVPLALHKLGKSLISLMI